MQPEQSIKEPAPMEWEKLISDRRFGAEQYDYKPETRTDFQRDYDRLIFGSPSVAYRIRPSISTPRT